MDINFLEQPKLAIGLISALAVALPQQALAQEESIEEIVTTGTRAQARSVEDSPAPVDVLAGEYFTNQGDTDLQNLVRNIVPSYNVNVQPISDAATVVRPANLRGLAPDHTLVEVLWTWVPGAAAETAVDGVAGSHRDGRDRCRRRCFR